MGAEERDDGPAGASALVDSTIFRASARLTGFAQQLSLVLRELQRSQLTPESLNQLAEHAHEATGLAYKLQDLATLLADYLAWLAAHGLQDADSLLTAATEALLQIPKANSPIVNSGEEGRGPSAPKPETRERRARRACDHMLRK